MSSVLAGHLSCSYQLMRTCVSYLCRLLVRSWGRWEVMGGLISIICSFFDPLMVVQQYPLHQFHRVLFAVYWFSLER